MQQLVDLADRTALIAIDAGDIAMRGIGDPSASKPKGRFDVLVDNDLRAEEEIVPRLRALLPGSEVSSEEMTQRVDWTAENVWIVDPLDGSNNYFAAIPYMAISIALRQQQRLTLAVVHDPVLHHTYTARHGDGARRNGRSLRSNGSRGLARATVSLITNYSSAGRSAGETLYLRLNAAARRVVTLWAPAADLVRVATGHIDAVVCLNARYGDVCAGLLVLAEVGGSILGASGDEVDVAGLDPTKAVTFVASKSSALSRDLYQVIESEIRSFCC